MTTMQEIRAQLTSMYIGYRFEIKDRVQTDEYCILIFKERKHLGTLEIAKNTPMNQFWEVIKAYMLTLMR